VRVLVADVNETLFETPQSSLWDGGHEVQIAGDGLKRREEFVPLDAQRPWANSQAALSNAATTVATILVVDDDADLGRNLADILGDLGYDVDVAETGERGLQKAERRHYDLGALDLRLPGMDGVTLCRRLKQLRPTMVAMIITAFATDGAIENARAAGASHVVLKPLDCARFLSLIKESLG
jgi:CheY-like chemotaxis protein